jgi:hypothetical protein
MGPIRANRISYNASIDKALVRGIKYNILSQQAVE